MSMNLRDTFLQLVRLGIGHTGTIYCTGLSDWVALKALAEAQGLSAVVLDGIERFKSLKGLRVQGPDQLFLLEWIGEVLKDYEGRYTAYEKAISSLAGFYNAHGFKMMVLKGYACSLNWPKPNHRPCGDIDIWLFGQQREADATLGSWLRVNGSRSSIDTSHHHHTVFEWEGFMVENHYDFVNVHHHRSHRRLERIFKELGMDDSCYVDVLGERVWLPSPNLHALFLLKHAALHFVGTELTFRQILDWAFFVKRYGTDVDWEWLLSVIEEDGLTPFFHIVNAICIEDLGFELSLFPSCCYNPIDKEKVLNDIFVYEYHEETTSNILKRQINRFRRWKANEWKHKLCYKESMMSAFWSGVWNHLLKPKSI